MMACCCCLTFPQGLLFVALLYAAPQHTDAQSCRNIITQQVLDLDQVMGRWVSVEVLLHGETNAGQPMVTDLGMCPVVFLNRTGDDSLRLLWSEPAGDLTYHLKIMYPSRPDFWVVIGPQRGQLTEKHDYQQFAGSIQVLKAVKSHCVVIFCSKLNNDRLYTLLLARDSNLGITEIKGVHNMLERRNLPVRQIKRTCSSANGLQGRHAGALALALALLVAALVHSPLGF